MRVASLCAQGTFSYRRMDDPICARIMQPRGMKVCVVGAQSALWPRCSDAEPKKNDQPHQQARLIGPRTLVRAVCETACADATLLQQGIESAADPRTLQIARPGWMCWSNECLRRAWMPLATSPYLQQRQSTVTQHGRGHGGGFPSRCAVCAWAGCRRARCAPCGSAVLLSVLAVHSVWLPAAARMLTGVLLLLHCGMHAMQHWCLSFMALLKTRCSTL